MFMLQYYSSSFHYLFLFGFKKEDIYWQHQSLKNAKPSAFGLTRREFNIDWIYKFSRNIYITDT